MSCDVTYSAVLRDSGESGTRQLGPRQNLYFGPTLPHDVHVSLAPTAF